MNINLNALIDLYDNNNNEDSQQVAAITGVAGEDFATALFCHYVIQSQKGKILEVLPQCNQGTRNGKRLDRWISAKIREEIYLFQTEIKNWCSHSFGGKKYPTDSTLLKKYRIDRWKKEFDTVTQRFKTDQCNKVLIPMDYTGENLNNNICPLIIFWDSMHPEGCDQPYFQVDVTPNNDNGEKFQKLHVFSMSTYVHQLVKNNSTVCIDVNNDYVKNLSIRIDKISNIFSKNSSQNN